MSQQAQLFQDPKNFNIDQLKNLVSTKIQNELNDVFEDSTQDLDQSYTGFDAKEPQTKPSKRQQEELDTSILIYKLYSLRHKYILYPENEQYEKINDYVQNLNKYEPNVVWGQKSPELLPELPNFHIVNCDGILAVQEMVTEN